MLMRADGAAGSMALSADGAGGGEAPAHEVLLGAMIEGALDGELLASDFRVENLATSAADDLYYGPSAWRDWLRDLLRLFDAGASLSAIEPMAAGEDFILASFELAGRSVSSGEHLSFGWTAVAWLRDGAVSRAVLYASRREALDAVGLHE
jgi:ketosteroid isomerase-like protein